MVVIAVWLVGGPVVNVLDVVLLEVVELGVVDAIVQLSTIAACVRRAVGILG